VNLTFTGGKELARALNQLPKMVAERVLEKAVTAGAELVRQSAAQLAPRPAMRRRPDTIRLGDSIKVRTTEKGPSFVTVNVGTKVRYAHLVEYGHQIVPRTSKRGERRIGGRRGFVAPRPFMRPAFDENRESMIARIGDVLRTGIEAEAQALAQRKG
jgi:HK97 gp10 family phage protein